MEQDEHAQQIEQWAERIEQAGLVPIVTTLLELARPLGFLASQALLLSEPLLSGFSGHNTMHKTANLLEDPEQVDQLLKRLSESKRL